MDKFEEEAENARTLREETLRRESERLGRLMELEDEEDIAADFQRVHISGDDSSGVNLLSVLSFFLKLHQMIENHLI